MWFEEDQIQWGSKTKPVQMTRMSVGKGPQGQLYCKSIKICTYKRARPTLKLSVCMHPFRWLAFGVLFQLVVAEPFAI